MLSRIWSEMLANPVLSQGWESEISEERRKLVADIIKRGFDSLLNHKVNGKQSASTYLLHRG
jgi:hypothetical protein